MQNSFDLSFQLLKKSIIHCISLPTLHCQHTILWFRFEYSFCSCALKLMTIKFGLRFFSLSLIIGVNFSNKIKAEFFFVINSLCSLSFSPVRTHTAHTRHHPNLPPHITRLINAQTATKIWLRYYLEQLFGVRWRKHGRRYSRRTRPQNEFNEPDVRFYRATESTDYNECDCTDI